MIVEKDTLLYHITNSFLLVFIFHFLQNINEKDKENKKRFDMTTKPTIAHGLTHLYLSSNCFNKITSNFFSYFPDLQWLDLRNNKLTQVCKYDFKTSNSSIGSSEVLDSIPQEKNFLIKVSLLNSIIEWW